MGKIVLIFFVFVSTGPSFAADTTIKRSYSSAELKVYQAELKQLIISLKEYAKAKTAGDPAALQVAILRVKRALLDAKAHGADIKVDPSLLNQEQFVAAIDGLVKHYLIKPDERLNIIDIVSFCIDAFRVACSIISPGLQLPEPPIQIPPVTPIERPFENPDLVQ